jgi:Uncharacterized conserved protein
MSMIETVRKQMMEALKAHDSARKDSLSALLSALKAKAIDKRADLTEAEELEVISHEVKQLRETIESTPADHAALIDEAKARIAVYAEYLPAQMDAAEIKKTIEGVLAKLKLDAPSLKDKGAIMKNLMPLTKGKADGKTVNEILSTYLH